MQASHLRLVRAAPEPLGLYLRASKVDHKDLQSFITSGASGITGVVFEAKRIAYQTELLTLVLTHGLDAVLDPQTLALATPGGFSPSLSKLPWAIADRCHTVSDFSNDVARRGCTDKIAQFALKHGFTQILAPTHLVQDSSDPWLQSDIETVRALRSALNARDGERIQINYSLAMKYESFRNAGTRREVLMKLIGLPINSLWLNIDGCGSDMSPTAVRLYGDGAVDCQSLGLPIIADHMGGVVGLALLAFGVVGGLSHGVTLAERLDCSHWTRPRPSTGSSFGPMLRVYLAGLDLLLKRDDAEKFFETGGRARSHFGCRDLACCARGVHDMLQAPARHFLFQRTQAVAGLSQIPATLRPSLFMEEHLRRRSDLAVVAAQLPLPEALMKKASKQEKRLNDLRVALAKYAEERRESSFAQQPPTRRARDPRH